MKKLLYLIAFVLCINIALAVECGPIPTDGCDVSVDTTFVPGTYNLPSGIQITANGVDLDCNGAHIIVDGSHGIMLRSIDGATIKNCEIEGAKHMIMQEPRKAPIYLYQSKNIDISNCFLHDNLMAIVMEESEYNIVSNSRFASSSQAVHLVLSSHNTIDSIVAQQMSCIGIYEDSNHVIFTNSQCECSIGSGQGIELGRTTDSVVENNKVKNCQYGLHVQSSTANSRIRFNDISNNVWGLFMEGEPGTVEYNNIYDNDEYNAFVYPSVEHLEKNYWGLFDFDSITSTFWRADDGLMSYDINPWLCAPYPSRDTTSCRNTEDIPEFTILSLSLLLLGCSLVIQSIRTRYSSKKN